MKKSKKKIFKYLQSVLLTTSIIVSSAAAYTSAATTSSDSIRDCCVTHMKMKKVIL